MTTNNSIKNLIMNKINIYFKMYKKIDTQKETYIKTAIAHFIDVKSPYTSENVKALRIMSASSILFISINDKNSARIASDLISEGVLFLLDFKNKKYVARFSIKNFLDNTNSYIKRIILQIIKTLEKTGWKKVIDCEICQNKECKYKLLHLFGKYVEEIENKEITNADLITLLITQNYLNKKEEKQRKEIKEKLTSYIEKKENIQIKRNNY